MKIFVLLLLVSQYLLSEARLAATAGEENEIPIVVDILPSLEEPNPNLRGGGDLRRRRRRLSKRSHQQKQGKKRNRNSRDELRIFRRPARAAKSRGKDVSQQDALQLLAFLNSIINQGYVNKPEVEEFFVKVFNMSIQEVVWIIDQNTYRFSSEDMQLLQFMKNMVTAFNAYDYQVNRAQRAAAMNRSGPTVSSGGNNHNNAAKSTSTAAGSGGIFASRSDAGNTVSAASAYDHDHAMPDLAEIVQEASMASLNNQTASSNQTTTLETPNGNDPDSLIAKATTHSDLVSSSSNQMTSESTSDSEAEDDDDEDEDDEDESDEDDDDDDDEDDDEYDEDEDEDEHPTDSTLTAKASLRSASLKPPLALVEDEGIDNYWLGECEGDCDYNSDCSVGLVCGFRHYEGDDDGIVVSVPGCSLDPRDIGNGSADFCHKPRNPKTLVIMADRQKNLSMENYPLQRCQGDCWTDSDCDGDLVCIYFEDDTKDAGGCKGWAEQTYSYCMEP